MNFKFPINLNDFVLREKKYLKFAKKLVCTQEFNVKFLGGYTQNITADWLEIFLRSNKINPEISQSDWGPASYFLEDYSVFESHLDLIVVFILPQDFYPLSRNSVNLDNPELITDKLESLLEECKNRQINVAISILEADLICFPAPLRNSSFLSFMSDFNHELNRLSKKYKNLYLYSLANICSGFDVAGLSSPRNWYNFGQPLSPNSSFLLANYLRNLIRGLLGLAKKVLITDLDNTLWGGVIGDDGVSGIMLGNETPEGRIYADIQHYILKLKERGIFISIASKNEPEIAEEAFSSEHSVLKLTDFTYSTINWDRKSENIKKICEFLNIGLDSVLFLDDNPVEREEVKRSYPEIEVLDVSSDPYAFLQALKFTDPFCSEIDISREDQLRNKTIEFKKKEELQKQSSTSYSEFLKNLDIELHFQDINENNFSRCLQLNNKTNQFNFTTCRLKQDELMKISKDRNHDILTYSVKDKFCEYGLVGVVFLEFAETTMTIKNWIMSCRVFNKTIEHAVINKIISIAREKDIRYLLIQYIPSKKNKVVKGFLEELNCKPASQDNDSSKDDLQIWSLEVTEVHSEKSYVRLIY